MRAFTSIRRPLICVLAVSAIFLFISSICLAGDLVGIRVRLDGRDLALKSTAVTDGHEVYLPLDVLAPLQAGYTLMRREESAIIRLPNSLTVEIALAKPGRESMLPITSLTKPLLLEYVVQNGVCHIRTVNGPRLPKPEPAVKPVHEAKQVSAQPAIKHDEVKPKTDIVKPVATETMVAPPVQKTEDPQSTKPAEHVTTQTNRNVEPDKSVPVQNPPTIDQRPVQLPGGVDATGVQQPSKGFAPNKNVPLAAPGTGTRITGLQFEAVDGNHARLRISTTGKVTALPSLLRGPARLAIDLPNTTLQTEGTEWPVNHPFVSAMHVIAGDKPGTCRLILDLVRLVGYRLIASDQTGVTLNLNLPRGSGRRIQDVIVVVDPGHGGPRETGCVYRTNGHIIYEKNVTLAIAKKVREALVGAGAHVLMTREEDVQVPLAARPGLATSHNADLFVSIHIDDCPSNNTASGTTAYYHGSDPDGWAFANSVVERIAQVSGLPSRGARSDLVRFNSGMAVLRHSTVPAILIEVGYMNNSRDRGKILNEEFQQSVAQAICDGIRGYVEGSLPENAPLSTETK